MRPVAIPAAAALRTIRDHGPDRRSVKALQQQHDTEADRCNQDVVRPGLVEVDAQPRRTRDTGEPVLAARQCRPAECNRVHQRGEGKRQTDGRHHAQAVAGMLAGHPENGSKNDPANDIIANRGADDDHAKIAAVEVYVHQDACNDR